MKYFLLREEKRIVDSPQLINWHKNIPIQKLRWGTYHEVPPKTVLFIKENKNIYFPDIMLFPFLMISRKIKDILDLYEPNMGYRQIILIENKNERCMQYFIPHLMRLECLSKKTEYNFDHSEVKKAVLEQNRLIDKCIFELGEVSNRQVIVRQDFLESVLRREAIINFERAEIEGESENG